MVGRGDGYVGKVCSVEESDARLFGANVGAFPRHHFETLEPVSRSENEALQVRFAGPDEMISGFWRSRENSDTFSLELVTAGTLEFTQFGQRFLCEAGSLFIVQLHAASRMRCVSEFASKKTVALTGRNLPGILNSLKLSDIAVVAEPGAAVLEPLFDQMYELLCRNAENCRIETAVLAYRILLELSSRVVPPAYPKQLAAILQYLEENLHRPLSIAEIAEKFHIGKGTIFRLFRTHGLDSPNRLMIHLRMARAAILLKETSLSIKDIAVRTGYSNPLYFSAEFRRIHKQSPSCYRTLFGK